jgi:hypothetical protein
MIENPTISIEYQITKDDFVSLNSWFLWKRLWKRRLPIGLTVFWLYIVVAGIALNMASFYLVLGAIIGTGVIIGFAYAYSFLYPEYLYKRDPKLQAKVKQSFNEEGITNSSQYGQGQVKWDYFNNFLERERGYILVSSGTGRSILIPHQALTHPQNQILHDLLHLKLSKTSNQK